MAPRIKGRGLRGASIPKGYLVGRIGHGAGDMQLLRGRDLRGFGIGGENQAAAAARALAGFQFFEEGLMLDHEVLGAGTWGRDVTFRDGDPGVTVNALVPSTGAAALEVWSPDALNIPTLRGTMAFSAGNPAAVVTWIGGVYTNPAGRVITLRAPTPADATLSNVTGYIPGEGA